VTIRDGSDVTRSRFNTLDEAVAELRLRVDEIAQRTDMPPTTVFKRELSPVQQVVARGLIDGSRTHGGVDVRGDGSVEAWIGRWVRKIVEPYKRESAYEALARALDV
jgi:hypothetical protein